jgi:hypothetical protein
MEIMMSKTELLKEIERIGETVNFIDFVEVYKVWMMVFDADDHEYESDEILEELIRRAKWSFTATKNL